MFNNDIIISLIIEFLDCKLNYKISYNDKFKLQPITILGGLLYEK